MVYAIFYMVYGYSFIDLLVEHKYYARIANIFLLYRQWKIFNFLCVLIFNALISFHTKYWNEDNEII